MSDFWLQRKKAIAAFVAFLGIALTQGLIVGTAAKWSAVIIGLASVYGVHESKNKPVPSNLEKAN